jgi:hypothetical protein
MKIVQGDEIPFERALEYRGGTFHFRRLLEGEPDTLGNFELTYGRSSGDFYSPRHRHNFEQFRLQLEGEVSFGHDGEMKPGVIGYFPEGVHYGPQSQDPATEAVMLVLQFGGASGSGYLSSKEVKASMSALKDVGEFKAGVFRRKDDVEGKRNVDAHQAIWEHVQKRPMVYPKPRYEKPIFMDPANWEWVPVEGAHGVSEKPLGVFTERRSQARFLKLEPGASYEGRGRRVYFAMSGKGEVSGQPLRALTCVYLDRSERARFTASEATVLCDFGLPDLAGLTRSEDAPDRAPALALAPQAAE